MENQYSYYTSDQESSGQNMNYEEPTEEKKKRKVPRWVQAACLGLIFGLVASAAFQTSNIIADKITGKETTSGASDKEAKTTTTANSTKLTTSSGTTVTTDIAQIVSNTMPSVVSITSMSVQQVQSFFGGIQEQQSESAGSGIIIGQNDDELLIVTNNHVVEGSDTLTVSFIDEESVEANIKGTNPDKDLAVVAVPLKNVKDSTMDKIAVATLGDSTELQVGEPAIAIGNALGYGQSVTTGIISATNRSIESYDGELIQTDAAINPGNSGGALLNANGEVIGINSAKIAQEQVEGIGYAIPISDASDIITNLMNQETKTKVAEEERGYIGIKGVDVTDDSAQMYNMPTGVYISEVLSGTGAEKAGLTKGSVITAINGTTVDSMEALQEQLQYYRIGEKVTLTIQIPGKNGEYDKKDVEVTLGEQQR
ncbi:S1C family serine protease [Faecalicatena contorta]|uniref:S1C family serine protease n=1 Tax=Faecalicatena contorta TaxID=39482 RepID=UPI001F1BA00A|nr:trypsin-like peptidase domain-containing protein [Faecalicatena contorta]MCF2681608.1 trypsin-like peptidase domain-containing protein [Faecalicatena contorta]